MFRGWEGHRWAMPDLKHLRHLLRHTYEHPEEARTKGARARTDMLHRYSLTHMAEEVLIHTDRIRNSPIYKERRKLLKKAKRGSKKKTSPLVDEL